MPYLTNKPEIEKIQKDFQDKYCSLEKNPFLKANFISKLFYFWLLPILRVGNKVPLEQSMNYPLRPNESIELNHKRFKELLTENIKKGKTNHLCIRTLLWQFKGRLSIMIFLDCFNVFFNYIGPIMVFFTTRAAENDSITTQTIIELCSLFFIIRVLNSIISSHCGFQFATLGMKMKLCVIQEIYQKGLFISTAYSGFNVGRVTNLIQVDANKFDDVASMASWAFQIPINVAIGLTALSFFMGFATFAGVFLIFFLGFFGWILSRIEFTQEDNFLKAKDIRVKLTTEVLTNIKFVKLYSLENIMTKLICAKRAVELKCLKCLYYVWNCQVFMGWFMVPADYAAVLAMYIWLKQALSPSLLFTFFSITNSYIYSLFYLPNILVIFMDLLVSLKRIDKFILSEEVITEFLELREKNDKTSDAIEINNGSFYWEEKKPEDEEEEKKEKKDDKKEKKDDKIDKNTKDEKKDIEDNKKQDFSNGQSLAEKINALDEPIVEDPMDPKSSFQNNERLLRDSSASIDSSFTDLRNSFSNSKEREISMVITESCKKNQLTDINIKIPKGQLVGIIGEVGAGKSSLFHSFFGNMRFNQGSLQPKIIIEGKIAYVNQKPWIQGATIKHNVLFGNEYDDELYKDSIKYSCMNDDLNLLPEKDETMLGDKGVNLSGGQKARVALARALYSKADVILLDDPLSAVDIKVGKFLMKETILKYLNGKTRVLITHAIYYLKFCDYIYVMKDGLINCQGTYEELKDQEYFQKFISVIAERENAEKNDENESEFKELELGKSRSQKKSVHLDEKSDSEDPKKKIDNPIILSLLAEDREVGKVKMSVYWKYCQHAGGFFFFFFLLLIFFTWASFFLYNYKVLAEWSDLPTTDPDFLSDYWRYYGIFMGCAVGYSSAAFIRAVFLTKSNLKVASAIHINMIRKLTHTSVTKFFDVVPVGRIVNRLTKDLDNIDKQLPGSVTMFVLEFSFVIIDVIIVSVGATAYIIIFVAVFLVLAILLQNYYITVFRESVRLESVSRSPIISFFFETLTGLTSVRAYKKQEFMKDCYTKYLTKNMQNLMIKNGLTNWYAMCMNLLTMIIQTPSLVLLLVFSDQISPGVVGMVTWVIMDMVFDFNYFLSSYSDLENKMVNVERCIALTNLEIESGYTTFEEENKKIFSWNPDFSTNRKNIDYASQMKGEIKFENVITKYRENQPNILDNISLTLNGGEKIGIVGRTGAGKSTFITTIYRGVELTSGSIYIDGVDIKAMDLKYLRSILTVIPQDAFFFNDTLQKNIDPAEEYTKEEIEAALDSMNLIERFADRGGIDFKIESEGTNLSVGERQLVQFARASLRKSKIIIMDEATSSIDVITEQIIQDIIKNKLKNCTILIIAHRIHTILDCDKILVLDKGRVAEFGACNELKSNPNGIFSGILEEMKKEERT